MGLVFCLPFYGCQKEGNLGYAPELDTPKAKLIFCNGTDLELSRTIYQYEDGKLVSETSFVDENSSQEKTYRYNANNQLVEEIYKDSVSNATTKTEFIYQGNLLVEERYDWGGFTSYVYENGRKVKQISHTKAGDEHHITTYKYRGYLLIEERLETYFGELISIKKYHYDAKNRPTEIFDGEGRLIEENIYSGNRLMEKRTYYFGIDPGFYPGYGNYVYKYVYE